MALANQQGAHSAGDGAQGEAVPSDLTLLQTYISYTTSVPANNQRTAAARERNREAERSIAGQMAQLGPNTNAPLRTSTTANVQHPFAPVDATHDAGPEDDVVFEEGGAPAAVADGQDGTAASAARQGPRRPRAPQRRGAGGAAAGSVSSNRRQQGQYAMPGAQRVEDITSVYRSFSTQIRMTNNFVHLSALQQNVRPENQIVDEIIAMERQVEVLSREGTQEAEVARLDFKLESLRREHQMVQTLQQNWMTAIRQPSQHHHEAGNGGQHAMHEQDGSTGLGQSN